ncbi:MAG: hypothetical protein R3185_07500, partial [Candidatus Thermoplasmatota archaeon]|nr:hypothetical protein [Candidatus Thermoplasmatota archaeon]
LGTFAKDDLATTLNGDPYTWYSFPLSNGTTWEASFDLGNLVGGQPQVVDLTFEATYNPSIPTKDGEFPGFDVVGYTAEGNLTMEYDYVPAIGWFGHLFIYNPHSDGDDWVLHLMTMGSGTNWTGTYYVDEARPLFEANTDTFVNPEDPGANQVGAPIMGSATVSEEATYVTGFLYSYAFAGASDTSVVDPDHERHGFTSVGAPFSFAFAFVDVDAKPGDWYLESTGAGVAAGGGAFLYEIVETTGTL